MRSWSDDLDALRAASLFRTLRTVRSPQGPVVVTAQGAELLNFSSNDYLGLASSPAVREFFQQAVAAHGAGSGASRLVCGTLTPHTDLEDALAAFKKTEAALTFTSGYAAALGALPALVGAGDTVILDKLSHACLIDGAKLSGATLRVFPHNRTDKLESLLRQTRAASSADARVLVVTESVFSMDGDWAELAEIVRLKQAYGALLLLDEAHAFGILGSGGRGLADKLGLAKHIDIHFGTLSKAAGLSGGYLCASRDLIDLLINRARSFIYSTAPPPAVAATAAEIVRRILPAARGDERRARLWENLTRLHAGLQGRIPAPDSAIVPLIIGGEQDAMDLSARLLAAGFLIPAIRYPTVARGSARLRLTLSAAHTGEQIDRLTDTLLDHLPG